MDKKTKPVVKIDKKHIYAKRKWREPIVKKLIVKKTKTFVL